MKSAPDLAGGPQSETRLDEQTQTTLPRPLGRWVARAERIAYAADGQGERAGAPLRCVEEAGGHARCDGMELECGNVACAAQQ